MRVAIARLWGALLARGNALEAMRAQVIRHADVTPTQADVLHTLTRAHALLSNPRRLSRGAMAQDTTGEPVQVRSHLAYAFCAIGAAIRYSPEGSDHAVRTLDAAAHELFGTGLRAVNQGRDHALILAVYERAIANVALQ